MSRLLELAPYGPRDHGLFLSEMNALTHHHIEGSPYYARIWREWEPATKPGELPFLHVGLFKTLNLRTEGKEIVFQRTARSSSTSGVSSRIVLDRKSSELQARSVAAILKDHLGQEKKPLLILDSSRALMAPEVSARIAAALSLRPMASDVYFLLDNDSDPASLKVELLRKILTEHSRLTVYGFSWMLWLAWGQGEWRERLAPLLAEKNINFVHSGGWKKLETKKVDAARFNSALLRDVGPESQVLDFYGLVEQVGVIYPLCPEGYRHVPVWAEVLVRDPYTLDLLEEEPGQLQLLNTLAWGGPYHSVLTDDLAAIVPGMCPCGRYGKRFTLHGRIPQSELRGCANV